MLIYNSTRAHDPFSLNILGYNNRKRILLNRVENEQSFSNTTIVIFRNTMEFLQNIYTAHTSDRNWIDDNLEEILEELQLLRNIGCQIQTNADFAIAASRNTFNRGYAVCELLITRVQIAIDSKLPPPQPTPPPVPTPSNTPSIPEKEGKCPCCPCNIL